MTKVNGPLRIAICAINTRFSQSSTAPEFLIAYASKYLSDRGFGESDYSFEKLEFSLADSPEFIVRRLASSGAEFYGFSTYIWNVEIVRRLVGYVRSAFPETLTAVGGPEVISVISGDYDAACGAHFAVCGEGEESFARLVETLIGLRKKGRRAGEAGKDEFVRIDGVAADSSMFGCAQMSIYPDTTKRTECPSCGRDEENNVRAHSPDYFCSKRLAVVRDVDSIPSIYTRKYLSEKKRNYVYLETSRGCPGHCHYCLSSLKVEGVPAVRRFSLDRVFREIDAIVSTPGIERVRVIDRTFNEDIGRARAIFEKVEAAAPEGTVFQFEINPAGFDEGLLAYLSNMKKACLQFEIGIQSFDRETLKSIGRDGGGAEKTSDSLNIQKNKYTTAEIVDFLVNRTRVDVHADLMYALPADTYEKCVSSFDRLLSMLPASVQFWQLKLLRGTRLRRDAESAGLTFEKFPPYAAIRTREMDAFQILRLQRLGRFLDLIYNHGHVTTTVKMFFRIFEKPSEFFFCVADYFEANSIPESAVSKANLFQHLKDFAAARMLPERRDLYEMTVDCLRYDFVRAEKKRFSLPDFLKRAANHENDVKFERFRSAAAAAGKKIRMSRSVSLFGFGFDVDKFSRCPGRSVLSIPRPERKECRLLMRHIVNPDGTFDAQNSFIHDPADVSALDFLNFMDKNIAPAGENSLSSRENEIGDFEAMMARVEVLRSSGAAVVQG